jgi:predicted DNA-binding protein (UPF0251 family)
MTVKNEYVNRSKISEKKFRELLRFFAFDLDASQIAHIMGLNRNTVNRYLKEIRRKIAEYCKQSSPLRVRRMLLYAGIFSMICCGGV